MSKKDVFKALIALKQEEIPSSSAEATRTCCRAR